MVADPNTHSGSFQLGFDPGSRLFSGRPLVEYASTNLIVMVDDKVYVLVLTTDPENYAFKVSLDHEGAEKRADREKIEVRQKPVTAARLIGLLDKCKSYDFLKKFNSDSVEGVSHAAREIPVAAGSIIGEVTGVWRDHSLDTVVFRLVLGIEKDEISRRVLYDPERIAVRVGDKRFTQSIVRGSGEVVEGASVENIVWVAITGDGGGGRNELMVDNDFDVELVPLPTKFDTQPVVEVEPVEEIEMIEQK